MTTDYTPMELMICAASGMLEDGRTVVVGTGAPCAATVSYTHLTLPTSDLV